MSWLAPSWDPLPAPKITLKKRCPPKHKKNAEIHSQAPKEEYSGALGSQNYSKMESKTDLKATQKGSLLKNMKNLIFAAIYYT